VLALAVELVVGETEAMRTAFVVSDDVAQVVHPAGGPALTRARADAVTGGVRVLDLSGVPDARERAAALVEADRALPFALDVPGLARQTIVRLDATTVWWSLVVHHAILDAYGITLVVRRVAEVFTALTSGRDVGPSPFGKVADVVAEETRYAVSPERERDRERWASRVGVLDGGPGSFSEGPLAETVAGPVPADAVVRVAHDVGCAVGPLEEVAARSGAGWPDVVAATFAVHLALVAGRRRVSVAMPAMNRMGSVAAVVPTMRVNVLPVVVDVAPGQRVDELVTQVRERVGELRRHGRYPAEQIVRDAGSAG